jgi:hypothetical protein
VYGMGNVYNELYCNEIFSPEAKGNVKEFRVYGSKKEPIYQAIQRIIRIK